MKELLIEEKAKAYDEIIKKANKMHHENCEACQACIEELIPELKESEDERIRNFLIDFIKVCGWTEKKDQGWPLREECIAWLEKQRSKDNVEDVDILHRFSFYSYKDEPNVLYLSGLYVNEECRNKGIGTKILEVADEVAKSLNCHAIRLKTKKDSNAERLYRTHGYNSLAIEERDEIWLEKQGEQKSLDDVAKEITKNKETATSFLKSCGIMNVNGELADEYKIEQDEQKSEEVYNLHNYLYGKQKPIIPKFRIGDIITPKDKNEHYTITDIVDEWYEFREKHINGGIPIHYQDAWQLVEQKPAWSEEDKEMSRFIGNAITVNDASMYLESKGIQVIDAHVWLEELKERVQPQNRWKPSEGQLECLGYAIEKAEKDWSPLMTNRVYLTLKALKEQLEKL